MPNPLPALILFSDHGNNWDSYLDYLYCIYLDEIVNASLSFDGLSIRYKFDPETDGKGFGFWHLISEGKKEEDRTPDFRRCERMRWVAWILQNAQKDPDILWWRNQRGTNIHVVLWLHYSKFAVVLAARSGYYLLKTSYVVKPNREKDFYKEWQNFQKTGTP